MIIMMQLLTTMLEQLEMLDKEATLALNTGGGWFTDAVMPVFSQVKVWIPLYLIVLGIVIYRMGWKAGLVVTLALVLNVVFADQLANLVKNAVARLRPCVDPWMTAHGVRVLEGGGGCGFYSGHAANVFSFAMCSTLCLAFIRSRKGAMGRETETRRQVFLGIYGFVIFLWAVTVSISRVYCGKHFIGDITAGALSGLVTGSLLAVAAIVAVRRIRVLRESVRVTA